MTVHRALILTVAIALGGCSKDEPTRGETPAVDAGPGDAPDTSTCVPACDAVHACRTDADVDACRAQCAKELAGDGYLIQEFANEFFRELADHDAGANCSTLRFLPWVGSVVEPYDAGAHDPAILQECIDGSSRCTGVEPTGGTCFIGYYVWNTSYRDAYKACWALPCGQQESCLQRIDAELCGMPWVGIPPDPEDLIDRSCMYLDAGPW